MAQYRTRARSRYSARRVASCFTATVALVAVLAIPHRGHFLRLRAEMKVPGRAWLEFTVEPGEGGGSVLRQRAIFFPSGLGGRLYWFAILPFHGVIFAGMAAAMAAKAAKVAATTTSTTRENSITKR